MLSSTSRSLDLVNACRIKASSGDRGGCYHSIPVHEKVCQLAQLENVVLQVSFTSLPIPLNSITAGAHVASSQLSLLLGPKTTFLLQLAQCEKKYYRGCHISHSVSNMTNKNNESLTHTMSFPSFLVLFFGFQNSVISQNLLYVLGAFVSGWIGYNQSVCVLAVTCEVMLYVYTLRRCVVLVEL